MIDFVAQINHLNIDDNNKNKKINTAESYFEFAHLNFDTKRMHQGRIFTE